MNSSTPLTNSTEEEAKERLRLKVERLDYLPDSATVHVLMGDLRKLWASLDHEPSTDIALDWKVRPHDDLADAIREFKAALPGWWYSVAECQVSCDASCAPTTESPDINLIPPGPADPMNPDPFDAGFHANLGQPSTLADALRDVLAQALAEKAALSAEEPAERDQSREAK